VIEIGNINKFRCNCDHRISVVVKPRSDSELEKTKMVMRTESSMASPSSYTNVKAAKQWEEVEVTSCFRTGGSMPIPKAAVVIPVYTIQRKELPQHQAEEEILLELEEEEVNKLKVSALPSPERIADGIETEQECSERASVFSVTTNLADPPAPPPRVQQCKKHSRCHCDDFSLGSLNFFDVVPQA